MIAEHHVAVAAVLLGPAHAPEAEWQLAVNLGLVDPLAPHEDIFGALHAFGATVAHLGQAKAQARYGPSIDSMIAEIRRNPVPMTEAEHHAAVYSTRHAAELIVGLGNRAGATVGSVLIEADRELDKRLRSAIQDSVAAHYGDDEAGARQADRAIAQGFDPEFYDEAFRGTTKRLASDIGHSTEDWTRDIQRIAQTEGHTAVSNGVAEAWRAEEGARQRPRPVLVFKIPRPGACHHCIDLHLEGGSPRIYLLSELEGNGTNVGRKTADWRAVVGSTHPWCGCPLLRVPSILEMPKNWKSGRSAPTVIGPGGDMVMDGPSASAELPAEEDDSINV